MRSRTVLILILLTLVIVSSSGCMGISQNTIPKLQPIAVPVVKPASSYVEMKDALNKPANATDANVTSNFTITPTPTSRFIYV